MMLLLRRRMPHFHMIATATGIINPIDTCLHATLISSAQNMTREAAHSPRQRVGIGCPLYKAAGGVTQLHRRVAINLLTVFDAPVIQPPPLTFCLAHRCIPSLRCTWPSRQISKAPLQLRAQHSAELTGCASHLARDTLQHTVDAHSIVFDFKRCICHVAGSCLQRSSANRQKQCHPSSHDAASCIAAPAFAAEMPQMLHHQHNASHGTNLLLLLCSQPTLALQPSAARLKFLKSCLRAAVYWCSGLVLIILSVCHQIVTYIV